MKDGMEAMARQQTIISAIGNYSRQLFGFIRSRVKTNEDAEDILQDVWYQFSNLAAVDDIDNIGGWLYRVARNRIIDKSRKKKDVLLDDFSYEDDDGVSFFSAILASDEGDAEMQSMQRLFWDALMDALQELPEKQRNVFVWNELEDMTLQQIADRENENIKTIISRKRYAVIHLRSRLETLYNEFLNN
jgi:RNA polymerase sigma factor (sigma-70 family)